MKVHLRRSADFQKVYRNGKRYEGVLMNAFVLPNSLSYNRLGITASRKALGNAVQRNRAKRLLRETFRQQSQSIGSLLHKYDWVINAKRRLAAVKVSAVIEDFGDLLSSVAMAESKGRE